MKFLNHLLKLTAVLMLRFLCGYIIGSVIGYDAYAPCVGVLFVALSFVPLQMHLKGAFFTITATDVVTEFGAVYREGGQSIQDIMNKLMQPSVTAAYFPMRVTNKTILDKVSAEFARVLQRFQKDYTPVGGVTFEPLSIPLSKLKIDLLETPDDLEESWLGFLASNSLSRKDWPFITWYLMNSLIQADKDLEAEIYAGVQGSITPGTANTAGTTLNGIKKQINTLNTAGTLSLISVGASPTDAADYVDYVEEYWASQDRLLRNEMQGDYLFMSQDNRDLFRDGMRIKYNEHYPQVADTIITKMRNDNVNIIGLPSMVGSNKIWNTPSWNRQMGFKKPENEKVFAVENIDRAVKAYTDYYKGFGFWIAQYVNSNDVELS